MSVAEQPNDLWWNRLLMAFFAFCVLPFFVMCLYAHPSADDWYMAVDGRELGFWKANIDFYRQVTGRYASTALLYLHPILVSFTFYKGVCLVLLAAYLPLFRWALRAWLPGARPGWLWLTAAAGFALFLWGLPSPAQGLYWATGIGIYMIAALLVICLAAVLGGRCLDRHDRPTVLRRVAAALLAFIIVGCTEVGMALLILHLIVLNGLYVWRNRRVSSLLITVLAVAAIGAAIVVLAPGNVWRMSQYSGPVNRALLPSLILSAKLAVSHGAGWLTFTPFFLVSLLVLPGWPGGTQADRKRAWETLAVAAVLLVGTVWGGYFVGAWSAGKVLPPRAQNLIYLFFLIDWALLLHAGVLLWRSFHFELPRLQGIAMGLVFLALVANVRGANNIKTAWKDLLSGNAARFDRECRERYRLIESTAGDEVLVPPLRSKPKTLYFNDLQANADDWRNDGCARFFGKKSIGLTP